MEQSSNEDAIAGNLWCLRRITRLERKELDPVVVNGALLREMAAEHVGLLIDNADQPTRRKLIHAIARCVRNASVLVVAGSQQVCEELLEHVADSHEGPNPDLEGSRLYVRWWHDLRKEGWPDTRKPPCLIVVVDPNMFLCSGKNGWVPGRTIGGIFARLVARYGDIPIVIVTACLSASIGKDSVMGYYGLAALQYFDGRGTRTAALEML